MTPDDLTEATDAISLARARGIQIFPAASLRLITLAAVFVFFGVSLPEAERFIARTVIGTTHESSIFINNISGLMGYLPAAFLLVPGTLLIGGIGFAVFMRGGREIVPPASLEVRVSFALLGAIWLLVRIGVCGLLTYLFFAGARSAVRTPWQGIIDGVSVESLRHHCFLLAAVCGLAGLAALVAHRLKVRWSAQLARALD